VLALVVSSIGAGAKLRVATHGVGFEPAPRCTGGPPVRQNARAVVGPTSEGECSHEAAGEGQTGSNASNLPIEVGCRQR
jgi:hypothetical protein